MEAFKTLLLGLGLLSCASAAAQAVSGADFIGTSRNTAIYATNIDAAEFIVVDISDSVASETNVTWTGGFPAANAQQRLVSRAAVKNAGELVTAAASGNTLFTGRFYVFKGPPRPAKVRTHVHPVKDSSVFVGAPEEAFGLADTNKIYNPRIAYDVYYQRAKWKFVFVSIEYDAYWDVRSLGNADVSDPAASPFPFPDPVPHNCKGLSPLSSESQRKRIAKSDLTPTVRGVTARTCYWSEALTRKHELFHVKDFHDYYYTPKMLEAESWIEAQEVPVTIDNLDPDAALLAKKPDLNRKVGDKSSEAVDQYEPEHETRAYNDGFAGYQRLSGAIAP